MNENQWTEDAILFMETVRSVFSLWKEYLLCHRHNELVVLQTAYGPNTTTKRLSLVLRIKGGRDKFQCTELLTFMSGSK
jgi:hypothetical protein